LEKEAWWYAITGATKAQAIGRRKSQIEANVCRIEP
jgi:hypothetical protein